MAGDDITADSGELTCSDPPLANHWPQYRQLLIPTSQQLQTIKSDFIGQVMQEVQMNP